MVKGICTNVHGNEATIDGTTYGINTAVVNMQYVKTGDCEFSIDNASGLIKFYKHVKAQMPTPQYAPQPARQAYEPQVKKQTLHRVITHFNEQDFQGELNSLSSNFDVFATQTHVNAEGLWSGVIFYR